MIYEGRQSLEAVCQVAVRFVSNNEVSNDHEGDIDVATEEK